MVQIVHGEDYKNEVERKENLTVSNPVPRGKIFDRYGRAVVDNTPLRTITYTRMKGSTSEERSETAKKLAKLIEVAPDKLTERDKKTIGFLYMKRKQKRKLQRKMKLNLKRKKLMINKWQSVNVIASQK